MYGRLHAKTTKTIFKPSPVHTALTASIGLVNQHKGNRMNLKYIAALIGTLSVATVSAAGLDAFQQKVNQIAEQHGVAAPDVKKEITGSAKQTAPQATAKKAAPDVSPIERIVAIDADVIRAIQAKDGKVMYLVDNGRFAFVGKMIDVWNRKELSTLDDIASAISHIDLARMGFKLENVNHISIGKGDKHVTVFVDPQCGWCHKLIGELNANPDLLNKYAFDFVVVPVLGERSTQLAKKLYCAKTDDQSAKYAAFVGGAMNIDRLEQNDDCDLTNFEGTRITAQAIGVRGVPMIIAPDGRFQRGKPQVLRDFLEPKADSKSEVAKK